MMILKYKYILFDLDGVITNTMPDHYRAWNEVLKEDGLHVNHLDIYGREGQPALPSIREIYKKYNRPLTLKRAKKIINEKEERFKKIVRVRYVAGARTFLKNLFREKFVLGLVTGTARHEVHRILADSIYELFSIVVTGSDIKHGKPHPEPYLKCINKMSAQKSRSIVIENAPYGIMSAKSAGLRCLALETSLPKAYLKQADSVFHSFKHMQQNVTFKNGF